MDKIDVLEVLDDAVNALSNYSLGQRASQDRIGAILTRKTRDEVKDARAAVAELIEAAKAIDANAAFADYPERIRLAQALAKIGDGS